MEIVALEKSGWNYSVTNIATPPKWFRNTGRVRSLTPVFRFGFESANRRMTVVCKNEGSNSLRWVRAACVTRSVFMKGAPEMVEQFLSSVPSNYDAIYKEYTLQGKRVISLAWKDLPESVKINDVRVRAVG